MQMLPGATLSVLIFRMLKGFNKIMMMYTRYCNNTQKDLKKNTFKKIISWMKKVSKYHKHPLAKPRYDCTFCSSKA